jgi:hypothetical protein
MQVGFDLYQDLVKLENCPSNNSSRPAPPRAASTLTIYQAYANMFLDPLKINIMNQELTHSNQQPDQAELNGLSAEHQERAIELRQNIADRHAQLSHTRATAYGHSHIGLLSGNTVPGPSATSLLTGDIATTFREQQLKSTQRVAKRHYKKHEAEYQIQAYKDAAEAGVEINGQPTERPKHSRKRRLGNLALAGADAATTAAVATSLVTPVGAKDIIPAYLAYRFGKGSAVRGSAAIRGQGDPQMALSTKNQRRVPISFHGSKKDLRALRERNNRAARVYSRLNPTNA